MVFGFFGKKTDTDKKQYVDLALDSISEKIQKEYSINPNKGYLRKLVDRFYNASLISTDPKDAMTKRMFTNLIIHEYFRSSMNLEGIKRGIERKFHSIWTPESVLIENIPPRLANETDADYSKRIKEYKKTNYAYFKTQNQQTIVLNKERTVCVCSDVNNPYDLKCMSVGTASGLNFLSPSHLIRVNEDFRTYGKGVRQSYEIPEECEQYCTINKNTKILLTDAQKSIIEGKSNENILEKIDDKIFINIINLIEFWKKHGQSRDFIQKCADYITRKKLENIYAAQIAHLYHLTSEIEPNRKSEYLKIIINLEKYSEFDPFQKEKDVHKSLNSFLSVFAWFKVGSGNYISMSDIQRLALTLGLIHNVFIGNKDALLSIFNRTTLGYLAYILLVNYDLTWKMIKLPLKQSLKILLSLLVKEKQGIVMKPYV